MRLARKTKPPATDDHPERELAYDIAQNLHDMRIQEGLSQGELAELIGTQQPRISVLESATKLPSLTVLVRIATALGRRLVVRFEKPEPEGESEK